MPENRWPVFTSRYAPRRPRQTDAQYENYKRGIERHNTAMGVYLGLFQVLCSHGRLYRTRALKACRQAGGRTGRNPQNDWSTPLRPLIPLRARRPGRHRENAPGDPRRAFLPC